MTTINIYGIPNCDVTKKAIHWLKANNLAFNFHDYKKEAVTAAKLNSWCKQIKWEMLLNKRGTTWRGLDPALHQTIIDQKSAVSLMQAHTSLIKRPLLEAAGSVITGYDEAVYKELLLNA